MVQNFQNTMCLHSLQIAGTDDPVTNNLLWILKLVYKLQELRPLSPVTPGTSLQIAGTDDPVPNNYGYYTSLQTAGTYDPVPNNY